MFTFQSGPVLESLEGMLQLASDIGDLANMTVTGDPGKWQLMSRYARERTVWLAIEAVTDVGTMLLDGLILRDAGSYEEIIHILMLEEVLSPDLADEWKQWVRVRQQLSGTSFQTSAGLDLFGWDNDYPRLPLLMMEFHVAVHQFLQREPGAFPPSASN
jgi:uncharacterized protein YutE (UPF0331/DUF86 family)